MAATTKELVVDGSTVVPVELATSRKARRQGLLGRSGIDGAILLRPTSSIHTFFMRFAIDAAFCDRNLRVLRTATLPPFRLTRLSFRTKAVLEAEAGAFDGWGIRPGSQLEISSSD
jgi:uncharacterized membrane protein (UPF0127 family)